MIYVLQVMGGREMAVLRELKKQHCHPMVPRQIITERRNGKDEMRENVLFPGYVFVDTSLDLQAYYRMRAIPNVIKFLGGGQPVTLPSAEADYILLLANKDKPLPPLIISSDGSIKDDLLKQLQSREVVSINKRQRRAKVKLQLLGEQHEINLAAVVEGEEPSEDAKEADE